MCCFFIGEGKNVHFAFYLESDTASAIAQEMVLQLGLSREDVACVAELIDNLVMKLVPNWKPCGLQNRKSINAFDDAVRGQGLPIVKHQDAQDSTKSDVSTEFCVSIPIDANIKKSAGSPGYSLVEYHKDMDTGSFISRYVVHDHHRHAEKINEAAIINESTQNSATSFIDSCSGLYLSLSSMSSLSLTDKEPCDDLKVELDAIDTQYHNRLQELLRMREEAMENARKKWMSRKKVSVS